MRWCCILFYSFYFIIFIHLLICFSYIFTAKLFRWHMIILNNNICLNAALSKFHHLESLLLRRSSRLIISASPSHLILAMARRSVNCLSETRGSRARTCQVTPASRFTVAHNHTWCTHAHLDTLNSFTVLPSSTPECFISQVGRETNKACCAFCTGFSLLGV